MSVYNLKLTQAPAAINKQVLKTKCIRFTCLMYIVLKLENCYSTVQQRVCFFTDPGGAK